jgi:23S rRNA (adenine2503-C2)-methyltransferase
LKNFIELKQLLADLKIPDFRIKQIINAVCKNFIFNVNEIKTISKDLRLKISEKFNPLSIKLISRVKAKDNETTKYLFELADGNKIESVLMQFEDSRNSVCISCQVGCQMGCKFCATGKLGFRRNLTYEEIFDQVLFIEKELSTTGESVSNIVYMGMGEPFMNYPEVMKSAQLLNNPDFLNIGIRRLTISTSGIVDGIRKLADESMQINLAVSLHAPNQELREKIMPIAKMHQLNHLIAAVKYYLKQTKRRVTYEYVLIDGVNDQTEQAEELSELIGRQLCHVNLIVFNPIDNCEFKPSTKENIEKFQKILQKNKINVTLRKAMGDEISAACGQLATKSNQI